MAGKFLTVYRRKAQGSSFPRIGLPDSIQPGDYLVVFIGGAYHNRKCMSVHRGYVLTAPMIWNNVTLDSARKIPWEDIDRAERPLEPIQEPVMDHREPKPVPVPKPPKPAPVVPPAPPKKAPEPPPAPKPPEKPAPKPPEAPKAPKAPKTPKTPKTPPKPTKAPEPSPKEPTTESLADLWSLLD